MIEHLFNPSAIIDLSAIQHNFSRIKTLLPNKKVIAMIKADAYGHGLVPVAQALKQADAFGVVHLTDAIKLRQAGIEQTIVLMRGALSSAEFAACHQYQCQPIIHQTEQIQLLQQLSLPHPIDVWLKLDTGMGRLGFSASQAMSSYQALLACHNVASIRFMTHLATIEEQGHATNALQLESIAQLQKQFIGEWSIAKSAAILSEVPLDNDWLRPGIMLYGVSPFTETKASSLHLKAAMTLQAPLISLRTLAKGEPIGYGSLWHCSKETRVGVVAIGYGQGYPRSLPQGTQVLLHGVRVPRIGSVCMDMIMLDLHACADAKVGDVVTLWGQGLPVEEIATLAGTLPHELLCGVSGRVQYLYRG